MKPGQADQEGSGLPLASEESNQALPANGSASEPDEGNSGAVSLPSTPAVPTCTLYEFQWEDEVRMLAVNNRLVQILSRASVSPAQCLPFVLSVYATICSLLQPLFLQAVQTPAEIAGQAVEQGCRLPSPSKERKLPQAPRKSAARPAEGRFGTASRLFGTSPLAAGGEPASGATMREKEVRVLAV